jgi:hypothetical protein
MDEAKLEEYIDLCTPSFLIKMKNTNDKTYFFRAYKSDYNKETTALRFTIPDIDNMSDEINLKVFGKDFEKLKATIIPEHKDMNKDIVTNQMVVDCGKENCGGNKLNTPPPPAPANPTTKPEIKSLKPPGEDARDRARKARDMARKAREAREALPSITSQSSGEFEDLPSDEEIEDTSMYGQGGGRKKKKKRRKKSSRSKKRINKRKNRTKKN